MSGFFIAAFPGMIKCLKNPPNDARPVNTAQGGTHVQNNAEFISFKNFDPKKDFIFY